MHSYIIDGNFYLRPEVRAAYSSSLASPVESVEVITECIK